METDLFKIFQGFVPIDYQLTAKTFLHYLRSLPEKRYNAQYHSLDVKKQGIEIFTYYWTKTNQQFYKWSDIEKTVNTALPGTLPEQVQNAYQLAFDI